MPLYLEAEIFHTKTIFPPYHGLCMVLIWKIKIRYTIYSMDQDHVQIKLNTVCLWKVNCTRDWKLNYKNNTWVSLYILTTILETKPNVLPSNYSYFNLKFTCTWFSPYDYVYSFERVRIIIAIRYVKSVSIRNLEEEKKTC